MQSDLLQGCDSKSVVPGTTWIRLFAQDSFSASTTMSGIMQVLLSSLRASRMVHQLHLGGSRDLLDLVAHAYASSEQATPLTWGVAFCKVARQNAHLSATRLSE